jgi:hypothetical protein
MYEDSEEEEEEDNHELNASAHGGGPNSGPLNNAAPTECTALFGKSISVELIRADWNQNESTTKGSGNCVLVARRLKCDVVCIAHASDTSNILHARLLTGLQQQLTELTNTFLQSVKRGAFLSSSSSSSSSSTSALLPNVMIETLLFAPLPTSVPIGTTFLTYRDETDSGTLAREEPTRKLLHDATLTPYVPTFRRSSSWTIQTTTSTTAAAAAACTKILNVHTHCPLPKEVATTHGKGYTFHMVHSGYRYYHYMQDKYDDKGWGCAYRSLQTIWSWFELHSYATKQPPNHQSIQETLVKVDPTKHSSFVGSKEWIGSQGVGYVLDECLGITSKFIFVPNGGELKSKARTLAQHFDVHGTPIMMGGGCLAFTILGVAWHQGTGDMSMLILDPHYCGSDDDVNQIVTKDVRLEGYKAKPCGWRRPESFEAQAFYNLCCPQRPTNVV